MKTAIALTIGLIGIKAGQADIKTLQELQMEDRMDVDGYEPEDPEMELIVSDFGAKAPNLGKHHHKKANKSGISKTVPIVAAKKEAPAILKPKQHAQEEDDDELGDPTEYEKADPVDADELDAYTQSVIADKQGKSISQMMAQDQEKRKVAEFERQQASAKKATDLANSLKRIPKPVPKKTDEEDVLDLEQKLDHEEDEDNEKATGEQQDFDGPVKQQVPPVSKAMKNEEMQPSLYSKKIAQEAAAVQIIKAQALLAQARAKSAQEQKDRAEKEELSEFEPVPAITSSILKTAQLEREVPEPEQRSRILDFSGDDTLVKTHASNMEAGDDAAWGAAAAAEEDLNAIDAKFKFDEKLQQEKKYLAEHPVPQITKAATTKTQALVAKPTPIPAAPQLSDAEMWLAHKTARSNQERLEEEMAEVDENYDYDGAQQWY